MTTPPRMAAIVSPSERMRHDPFRLYLDRAESAAPAQAQSSYARLAAQAETALGLNLDNADLGEQGVAALIERLRRDNPVLPVADCREALRAYGRFLTYYKAR
jgi:hypothetical protein